MGKPIQSAQTSSQIAPQAAGENAMGNMMMQPGSGVPPARMTGPQQAAAQAAPQLMRTPGPQTAPGQAMNQGLPVNQNALNYLNNWYAGTPASWGAPAQAAPAANPYQNDVVPRASSAPSRWSLMNAGTPAPTTASLQVPQAGAPAAAPQQQDPNWGALYGNGPNQFAQGFNPLASPVNGASYGVPANANV